MYRTMKNRFRPNRTFPKSYGGMELESTPDKHSLHHEMLNVT